MGSKKERGKLVIEVEYLLFMLAVSAIRALPLKICYSLANAFSLLLFLADIKHQRRAVQHILHSGIVKTDAEARSLARANFRHIAKLFVEIVKSDQIITKTNFREHIEIEMQEFSKEILIGKPRQVILATAHIGNWELAGTGYTMCADADMTSIMRPLNNPRIGEYIYKRRTLHRHKTFSRDKGLKPFLAAIKAGDTITIVSDQHASRNEGVVTSFFGHPARTHATAALLHLKTGIPILMCVLVRLDDDFHFRFVGSNPIIYKPTGDKKADIQRIAQLYTDEIEAVIRKYPEQWLWSHRRWLDVNRGEYIKEEDNEEASDD